MFPANLFIACESLSGSYITSLQFHHFLKESSPKKIAAVTYYAVRNIPSRCTSSEGLALR